MSLSLSRSVGLLFLAEFAFYISGYLVQMGAGRLLGPADYGAYSLVITLTLLVANLIGGSIPLAMSKFLSENAKNQPALIPIIKRQGAYIQAIFMGLLTLAFYLTAPAIAEMLGDPSLAKLFSMAAFIIPLYAADSFYFYYYSGTQRFAIQSLLKLVRALLRIIVILGLGYFFQLKGIVTGYLIVPLVVFLMAFLIDHRTASKAPQGSEASAPVFPLRNFLHLAFPITFFLVLFEILVSFDMYVIKHFFEDDALAGLYNAALTVARIPSYLFYALTLLLLPLIAASSAVQDHAKTRALITQALRFMLIFSFPFFAFALAYPRTLVTLFFGEAFVAAAAFLPSLALGIGLLSIIYVLGFAYQGAGRIRIPILFLLLGLALNILFDVLLLPSLGLAGLPLAKLTGSSLLFAFFLVSLARSFKVPVQIISAGKMLVAATLIFFTARLIGDFPTALFMVGPFLFLGYFFLLYIFKEITAADLRAVRSMFFKSRSKKLKTEHLS